jgi:hypothetical protein
MANNIVTTTAAFATTSMKPVPDEQIDALWGQNIADNTGWLYNEFKNGTRAELSFSVMNTIGGANNQAGTFFFQKRSGMSGNGTFFGSISGTHDDSVVQSTRDFRLYMNGTELYRAGSTGNTFNGNFGTDLRGISDGAFVPVVYKFGNAPSASVGDSRFNISSWSKG